MIALHVPRRTRSNVRLVGLAALGLACLPGCQASNDAVPFGAAGRAASVGAGVAGSGATTAVNGGGSAPSPKDLIAEDCSLNKPAARRIWRLTPTQYDNTLRDLLGTESSFGAGFPADDVGVGFSNGADALLMTPLLADKLQSAAQDSSSKLDLSRTVACAAAQRDDNCLRDFVTRFGERAFRRPLSAAELERYNTLAKAPGDFDAGARVVVQAMLQSPYFLYRFELGQPVVGAVPGTYALDDYEIASELSYLLWETMPDDALFEAAKDHQLSDRAGLTQQATRMLQDPRARPVVRGFVFDWLGLTNIANVPKDAVAYPGLTPEIRTAMIAEVERFTDRVMWGTTLDANGSVSALLNALPVTPDDVLAKFYATGQAAPNRRGVLTLGGVLLSHSRSNDSSPIHRGKLVRERLLCQTLPPPPAGLLLQPPGLDPSKTARERYSEHSENAYCGSCHKLMDPIGFAFEHFDGVGRYRIDENGLPIDANGSVVRNDTQSYPATDADGDFQGLEGLVSKLDASDAVRRCYALEWFRFAYGEGKTDRDGAAYPSCQAKRFQDVVSQTPGSLSDIVTALTQSDWFTTRSGADPSTIPAATEPAPPVPMTMSAAGSGAPIGAENPPGLAPGLQLKRTVENDWGMGYCYTYQVANTGTAPVTWSVPLEVRGMMNNHWQCQVTGSSGPVTFTGETYNQAVPAGGMIEFGFCAVVN